MDLVSTANIVEYWRRRYQRMNPESFVAANVMALITHTVVSEIPAAAASLAVYLHEMIK